MLNKITKAGWICVTSHQTTEDGKMNLCLTTSTANSGQIMDSGRKPHYVTTIIRLTNRSAASCRISARSRPALLGIGFTTCRRKLRGTEPSCTIGPINSPRHCQTLGISISISSANSITSERLQNR